MLSTFTIQRPGLFTPLWACALILCVIVSTPQLSSALEQNTAFIPFKINAPDPGSLRDAADKTLEQEVAAKGLTLMPRAQAEKLVDITDPGRRRPR